MIPTFCVHDNSQKHGAATELIKKRYEEVLKSMNYCGASWIQIQTVWSTLLHFFHDYYHLNCNSIEYMTAPDAYEAGCRFGREKIKKGIHWKTSIQELLQERQLAYILKKLDEIGRAAIQYPPDAAHRDEQYAFLGTYYKYAMENEDLPIM